jgi:hypothetical protein
MVSATCPEHVLTNHLRTFQEYAVSRRLLVFHHETVSWICKKSRQQENGAYPLSIIVPQDLPAGTWMWTTWPNFSSYTKMAQQYSLRNLGYPEDVLNYFDAIITIHGRAMKGGMLYGIPDLFFSGALLWTPGPGITVRYPTSAHM